MKCWMNPRVRGPYQLLLAVINAMHFETTELVDLQLLKMQGSPSVAVFTLALKQA